jgi:hypothetical protein
MKRKGLVWVQLGSGGGKLPISGPCSDRSIKHHLAQGKCDQGDGTKHCQLSRQGFH